LGEPLSRIRRYPASGDDDFVARPSADQLRVGQWAAAAWVEVDALVPDTPAGERPDRSAELVRLRRAR
jgi:hypothetical protein